MGWDGCVQLVFDVGKFDLQVGFIGFEFLQAFEDGTRLVVIGCFDGTGKAGDGAADDGQTGGELVVFSIENGLAVLFFGLQALLDDGQMGRVGEDLVEGVDDGDFEWFGGNGGGVAVMAAMGASANVLDVVAGACGVVG